MTEKNDCCEHNDVCRWAVGHNMLPGYLPDSDEEHFAAREDALQHFNEIVRSEVGAGVSFFGDGDLEVHGNSGRVYFLMEMRNG